MTKRRRSERSKRPGRGILWALVVLLAQSWVTAVAGERVEVGGVRAFDRNRVRSILLAGGRSPGSKAALEGVQEAYYRAGYLRARLSATRGNTDSTWVVQVEEGEQARVGRAHVVGLTSYTADETLRRLGLVQGGLFRPDDLTARVVDLLEEYDQNGHPFAQVWVDSLGYDAGSNAVHIRLFVVEGIEGVVRRVEVEGLKKTRPDLAVRIAGIAEGTPYSAALLQDAYVRLSASGVFTEVKNPTVRMSSDGRGVDAVLVVDEPVRSHSLTSALGYADTEGEDKRQISGLVNLRLNNIGGTLKNLGAMWSNDGRERVETRVDYRDQFFLGKRLALGATLHQIGLDTLYTWQSLGFEVERPVGRLAGSLLGVSLGVHGDRNVFSLGDLKRSWRLRTSLGTRYRRGTAYGNALSILTRVTVAWKQRVLRSGGDESLNQYIPEVETEFALRLRPVLHLRNALVYRGLESDERVVPLSEVFYIGGARTLRGYKENQFNGRRVATARTELLLGRTRSENVYLFGDVGYVMRETVSASDTVIRDEIVRAGYGFGLRTGSKLGNVDLSFGVGEKLSLQQTKVHVLLEQSF